MLSILQHNVAAGAIGMQDMREARLWTTAAFSCGLSFILLRRCTEPPANVTTFKLFDIHRVLTSSEGHQSEGSGGEGGGGEFLPGEGGGEVG